jgi:hypothetical protein
VRIVLLSGGNVLRSDAVASFATELGDSAVVDLVTWSPPTDKVRLACGEVVVLGPRETPPAPVEPAPKGQPPAPLTGLSPARVAAAVRWRRRRLKRAFRSRLGRTWSLLGRDRARTWRRVRRRPEAMALLDRADLVVALDGQAIRAAWTLARRRPGLAAVWGLQSAEIAARRLATARSAFDAEQVAGDDG